MTWSLDISRGDLNLGGPGGFAKVTGTQKLLQDLRAALLTPAGFDPNHPEFGSVLDGGVLPDGTVVETQIGSVITNQSLVDVEVEIRRVLADYQRKQLTRLTDEQSRYGGLHTFDSGEILMSIDSVSVRRTGDTLVAFVAVRTANNIRLSFAQAVA